MAQDRAAIRSAKNSSMSEAYTERRRQIAAAAAALFLEAGVDQVSMDDIAEAVGLAKPSLYHYFSTRDEIFFEINEHAFDYLFSRSEKRSSITNDPEQLLRGVFEDTFGFVHSLPGYARVVNENFRHLSPEYRAPVSVKRRRWTEYTEKIIQSGLDTGVFTNCDPHHATLAIFGMLNWSHQWYRLDGPTNPERMATIFFDMFMQGISKSPRPSQRPKRQRRRLARPAAHD
jgi:TetR/AcrR family transcriptional regulator, cholesterol catabolism regulator